MNTSIKGFTVEAFLDGDAAIINRDDFLQNSGFHVKEFYGQTRLDLVVISDRPFTDLKYKKSHLSKMKKDQLMEEYAKYDLSLLDPHDLPLVKEHYKEMKYTKADLIDVLMTVTLAQYYSELHKDISFKDLEPDFKVYGYCQGDVFDVLKVGRIDDFVNKKYLENIYFSTPMRVLLSDENGVVADLTESVDQYSEYDRKEALRKFEEMLSGSEYKKEAMQFLKDNLPASLEYVG